MSGLFLLKNLTISASMLYDNALEPVVISLIVTKKAITEIEFYRIFEE